MTVHYNKHASDFSIFDPFFGFYAPKTPITVFLAMSKSVKASKTNRWTNYGTADSTLHKNSPPPVWFEPNAPTISSSSCDKAIGQQIPIDQTGDSSNCTLECCAIPSQYHHHRRCHHFGLCLYQTNLASHCPSCDPVVKLHCYCDCDSSHQLQFA